jgi:hypothetical protein
MKRISSIVALLFVAFGLSAAARADEVPGDKLPFGSLTVEQVQAKLKEKNFFLYDCNSTEMFAGGHVPGAKWLAYQNMSESDLPKDKTATLVFYCANEH